mmetsp:Transcript_32742/g.28722  ORF Transcript_32742/g.28722 Transcript_32742/m.28722 type:complete len:162 (+) Transcript_32742:30-515(+)
MNNDARQDKQNKDTLVSLSDLGASKFIDVYYKVMDYSRNQVTNFYRPTSKVKWNGSEIAQNQLQQLWQKVPGSHHQLISVNAQPITVLGMSPTPPILITVNGKVSYLGSKPTFFSQTFVIGAEQVTNINNNNQQNGQQQPAQSAQYYIISDIFRLQQEVTL